MNTSKGRPKTGGRVKGTPNKVTQRAAEICRELNFEPLKELISCYREARKTYDNYAEIYQNISAAKEASGNPFPVEDKAHTYLTIASTNAREIVGYVHPKLKSIEHKVENPLDQMSTAERIEAHAAAIEALKKKPE